MGDGEGHACRVFASVLGYLQSLQRAASWRVIQREVAKVKGATDDMVHQGLVCQGW